MRLYIVVAVLTTLIYPLAASYLWSAELSRNLFGTVEGAFLCVTVGAVSSFVLYVMQKLSVHVSEVFRGALIRVGGAEIVGTLTVIFLEVLYQLLIGEGLPMTIDGFFTLQMPAFLATFVAYHIAGICVEDLVPSDAKTKRRR